MKLTIIRLLAPDAQERIDLGKIWPKNSVELLSISENERLYAAKFNDRLLGAVRVTPMNTAGILSALNIREITRRRGVGRYLVEEVLRDNPTIIHWKISSDGVEDREAMQSFSQALGFRAQGLYWEK